MLAHCTLFNMKFGSLYSLDVHVRVRERERLNVHVGRGGRVVMRGETRSKIKVLEC